VACSSSRARCATAVADGVTLDTDQGAFSARQVLIACGAHSAKLTAALTGKKVPLDTERGYHLMLPHERERLPFAVTSLERKFIMTPMAGGFASPARWNSPASNVRPICNAPGSCIA
jgi:glycine/D-amino acid oxidase-like deaminating enzyme